MSFFFLTAAATRTAAATSSPCAAPTALAASPRTRLSRDSPSATWSSPLLSVRSILYDLRSETDNGMNVCNARWGMEKSWDLGDRLEERQWKEYHQGDARIHTLIRETEVNVSWKSKLTCVLLPMQVISLTPPSSPTTPSPRCTSSCSTVSPALSTARLFGTKRPSLHVQPSSKKQ